MHAYVYKSSRKADTYVYLRERDGFALLPEPLRDGLGALVFVLEVALTPARKLARADAAVVRAHLAERGFHVQMPPHGVGRSAVERLHDMAALAAETRCDAGSDDRL
ncbi:MAG: YcgL domain-containing protein [Proteobacteria bacterium]|nr:YcgL domain-containing protein [Pseudomonadota bacterium]MBS0464005.1 YcgL domain-containing protein [Pseudomonadota bacterium]